MAKNPEQESMYMLNYLEVVGQYCLTILSFGKRAKINPSSWCRSFTKLIVSNDGASFNSHKPSCCCEISLKLVEEHLLLKRQA